MQQTLQRATATFMHPNKAKQKLDNNEPILGVISKSSDPLVAEVIGLSGFDYYMLDGEHGLLNRETITNVVRACEAVGTTPMLRVGDGTPKEILAALDAGMMGLMVAGLDSAESIQKFVSACKYPPTGTRGFGLSRAANYMIGTDTTDFVETANRDTLVLPQFEHPDLLPKLADMLAVPGVDGCVIGPRDLSLNMGFADGPNHPEVQAVIDQAIAIMRAAGVHAGITAGSAEAARHMIDRGATIILNSVPNLIQRSSANFLQATKS